MERWDSNNFVHFPWIDYVVSGEGEHSFPALVKRILLKQEKDIPPRRRLSTRWRNLLHSESSIS